jgi:hypothetical protein
MGVGLGGMFGGLREIMSNKNVQKVAGGSPHPTRGAPGASRVWAASVMGPAQAQCLP